jgi:hypothetical protein
MLQRGSRAVSRVWLVSLAFHGIGTLLTVCSCTSKALPRIRARRGAGRGTWKRERDATRCVAVSSCMKEVEFGVTGAFLAARLSMNSIVGIVDVHIIRP